MLTTLHLGEFFGRLGLISRHNNEWDDYQYECRVARLRSVRELEDHE